MMELVLIILFALARRVQGGWPVDVPRYIIVPVYGLLCAAIFYGNGELWWAQALIAWAATGALLLPGHKYVPASEAMKHYGPVWGYGYVIGEKIGNRFNIKLSRCADRWFIDGASCYGELWVGGALALTFELLKLL